MRLARFRHAGAESLGVALTAPAEPGPLLDVPSAALARDGQGSTLPGSMTALIGAGTGGLDAVRELVRWAEARQEPSWLRETPAIEWLTPVPERSCLAAGRNFGAHKDESVRGNPATGPQLHSDFPTGFIKLGRTLVPHGAVVRRPRDVVQMDYEVEVAVIVGGALHDATPAQARQSIFGYTVFNDLSAREWQLKEMKNNLLLLGKNFPGFGPIGPYILTADEVPDPSRLHLSLRVNGELRQDADCSDLIHGFDELVAFWSRLGLEAGDIVCTGTPQGVALHRKPDPAPFFLKPGDVVEATVAQIGTLQTRIA